MANIASVLRAEIARVARKEVRAAVQPIKRAVTQYRSDIAALKKRSRELEQQLRRLRRTAAPEAGPSTMEESGIRLRFSAKGFAAQRQRLGLSAHACGALIGASGQSVYKWEDGKARPRAKHLPAIAALRTMGKREAAARLEQLAA